MYAINTSFRGVCYDQNKYLKNLEYWLLSKSRAEQVGDDNKIESSNNNLAALYMEDQAKKMFEEKLNMSSKNKRTISKGYDYANILGILMDQVKLDSAKFLVSRTFDIRSRAGFDRQSSGVLSILSEIDIRLENVSFSIRYGE